MPRRNRVTPWSELVAVPDRGTVFGNRGVLHDAEGRIRRPWRVRRWILCELEFRGRHRTIMAPNRYTELFFLDEATGLAAGHRPCFECRRARFLAFRAAWSPGAVEPPRVAEIDARLHAERVGPGRSKRAHPTDLDTVPDGAFVGIDGAAFLVRGSGLLAWSPAGYTRGLARPSGVTVALLTPPSTVSAIREGYTPGLHPSAREAGIQLSSIARREGGTA